MTWFISILFMVLFFIIYADLFFHLVKILTHFYLQLLIISQVVLKWEYLLIFLVLIGKRHNYILEYTLFTKSLWYLSSKKLLSSEKARYLSECWALFKIRDIKPNFNFHTSSWMTIVSSYYTYIYFKNYCLNLLKFQNMLCPPFIHHQYPGHHQTPNMLHFHCHKKSNILYK